MTPEQTQKWEELKAQHAATFGQNCPNPIDHNRPIQVPLFAIPLPPVPSHWALWWRWKPDLAIPGACRQWWIVDGYGCCVCEKVARNECRRRKRVYPGKEFKVRVIRWRHQGDITLAKAHREDPAKFPTNLPPLSIPAGTFMIPHNTTGETPE